LDAIRAKIPDIAIRTSLIVGFPGETKKKFHQLRDFLQQSQLDRVGVFTYSHEENTAAYKLKDSVSKKEKEERREEKEKKEEDIYIGLKIREIFKASMRKIDWLAEEMCCSTDNIYKIFHLKTIDTGVLMRFCEVLQFNFFIYDYNCFKKFGKAEENREEDKDKKKEEEIHIGLKIQETFEASKRKIGWLANNMEYTTRNIYLIFEKETINTDILKRFCVVFEVNLFIDYYNRYKKFGKAEEEEKKV
jgi:hypothetical protein